MSTSALSVGTYGASVTRLHDFLGQRGFQLPASELGRSFFGPATRQALQQFQQQNGLPVTGVLDDRTAAALSVHNVDSGVAQLSAADGGTGSASAAPTMAKSMSSVGLPSAGPKILPDPGSGGNGRAGGTGTGAGPFRVQGHITVDYGLPASGLTIRAYSRGFGADTQLGETKTDDQGLYAITYEAAAKLVNLEIRAVQADGKEMVLSATKLKAAQEEVLNLVVPGTVHPLAPEYQRLSADMDKQVGGIAKLGQAQENDTRQGLTVLCNSTGWDARLLAFAATTAKQTGATWLAQDLLYALYRVGLPSDPQKLAMISTATVQKALSKASQAGIVSMNEQQISEATKSFGEFASTTRLSMIAPGALCSFQDLLKNTVSDVTQQAAFADLYFANPSGGESLWNKAAQLNIPASTISGRLAAKSLAMAEDTLLLQGSDAQLPANVKVINKASVEDGLFGEAKGKPISVPPLPPGSGTLYGGNLFAAVTQGIAQLNGQGEPGPYGLILESSVYADAFSPLPSSLATTADRLTPLLTAGFYGTGALPANTGLTSTGGTPTTIYVSQDPITAYTQQDKDGNYLFRVFERIQFVARERKAFVDFSFQRAAEKVIAKTA